MGDVSHAFSSKRRRMGWRASQELAPANFLRKRGDSTWRFCESLITSAPPQNTGRLDNARLASSHDHLRRYDALGPPSNKLRLASPKFLRPSGIGNLLLNRCRRREEFQ